MTIPYIAVVDYNLGNVKSMCNAISKVGAEYILTREREVILAADGLILPGVGAFQHGMQQLEALGLVDIISAFTATSKPFLGVCLGMQMLFDESNEHGNCKGLGLIPGHVEKLSVVENKTKLPHVGWNTILSKDNETDRWQDSILKNTEQETDVYFVHSYAANPRDQEDILSITSYNETVFCSSVKKGNIYGCQFHPEKSAESGLKILSEFIALTKNKKGN